MSSKVKGKAAVSSKKDASEKKKVVVKKTTRQINQFKYAKVMPRLYVRGVFVGYKRKKHTQHEKYALLKLENVHTVKEARWYVGKKVAYIPARTVRSAKESLKNRKRISRAIWGVIRKPHGTSGGVKAVFKKNLPPKGLGRPVRVMLYPSII